MSFLTKSWEFHSLIDGQPAVNDGQAEDQRLDGVHAKRYALSNFISF